MVKIYKQPFAHDGDAIAIPDASQPDGKMSNVDGWTPDYQLPKTDPNYKPVGRQEMNGVFKEVTEALGQVQVQGSATWSPDGAPYPINAQVYHNGKQWIALRANSVVPDESADWSAIGTANQLATKANTSTQVIAGTGLSGGGNLSANRTLTVKYGTAEGTAAQGNDSRIVNAVPNSRTISAGTGLTGGGTLAANRTLSIAASHTPIGVGQTWQDVKSQRSNATTYTNTSGRPIEIAVSTLQGVVGYPASITMTVGGASITNTSYGAGQRAALVMIVPVGATYRVTLNPETPSQWIELRS